MKRILLAALCACVAACGSFSPPPKDRFYRLASVPPTVMPETGEARPIVYVAPFTASGLHSERALVFAHEDGTSLEQHGYHFWIDSPRILLQKALADRLATESASRIVTEPTPEAALVVRGEVRKFEQARGSAGATADVELVIAVYEGTRSAAPAFEKTYARTVPARDGSAGASVAALGEGTAEILAHAVGDIERLLEQ